MDLIKYFYLTHILDHRINIEKSQTIELINKLREAGKIIKVGNGPATGYKVLD